MQADCELQPELAESSIGPEDPDSHGSLMEAHQDSSAEQEQPEEVQGRLSTQAAEEPIYLGSYKVVDLLGMGGAGAVFKAVDSRNGREVAIKVAVPRTISHKVSHCQKN